MYKIGENMSTMSIKETRYNSVKMTLSRNDEKTSRLKYKSRPGEIEVNPKVQYFGENLSVSAVKTNAN